MRFGSDERAQSTLVGAILLFAILIIAFSSYQAFVIPNQNAEVEFNHNQDVQTDMQDLRNSLLDVRSVRFDENDNPKVVSEHRPVRVQLGTQFPERLIALNPPQPSGTLETEDGTFEIRGAEVASTEFDQYENDLIRVHDTKLIAYEPSYTEYQEPPITRFEHSLGYNDFDGANITTSDQRLIRGLDNNIIDVILLDGDISRSSSGSVTVDPETVDGPTERVPIRSDNGPIELEFTTNQPEVWEEALSDVSSVNSVTPDGDSVTVVLENGQYDLRMTTVRLEGEGGDETFTGIQKEPAEETEGGSEPVFNTQWAQINGGPINEPETVSAGEEVDLTANVTGRESMIPIDNASAEYVFSSENGGSVPDPQQGSITNGEGTLTFDVPSEAEDGDKFEAYVTVGDDSDVVAFEVEEEEETMASRTEITSAETTGGDGSIVDFTVETDGTEDVVITGLGVDYADESGDADNVNNGGDSELEFTGSGFFDAGGGNGVIRLGDPPVDFENDGDDGGYETVSGGDTTTGTLTQFQEEGSGQSGADVDMAGETLEITLDFQDGSRSTYSITVD